MVGKILKGKIFNHHILLPGPIGCVHITMQKAIYFKLNSLYCLSVSTMIRSSQFNVNSEIHGNHLNFYFHNYTENKYILQTMTQNVYYCSKRDKLGHGGEYWMKQDQNITGKTPHHSGPGPTVI